MPHPAINASGDQDVVFPGVGLNIEVIVLARPELATRADCKSHYQRHKSEMRKGFLELRVVIVLHIILDNCCSHGDEVVGEVVKDLEA